MSRSRILLFSAAVSALAFVASGRADELDPVSSSFSAEPAASVPFDRALRPFERILRSAHPELGYSFVRAQGVLSAPGAEETTTIQTVSLSTFFNLGQFITFRYRPTWSYYSSEAFDNSFGQDMGAQFARSLSEWNFRAGHRFSDTSMPLVETGMQTSQEIHETTLQAQRRLGARTVLELGFRQNTRRAEGFSSSENWSTEDWLQYQISETVGVAAGVELGYASVNNGNNMSYHQLNGRINWRPTEKLGIAAHGGVETREFIDSDIDDARTPVYGASITYAPFDQTTFTIDGDQAVSASYFQSQVHRTNSWQATLSQRFLGRLNVSLSYRRRASSYSPTSAFVQANRQDEGRTWRVDIGTSLYNRGAITVFFQDKRNVSTDPRFAFDGHQIGLHLNVAY